MTASAESETANLWGRYRDVGSECAFAEVVRGHVDLVYSVALRRCRGDTALAQDVTQTVFADLLRKAPALPRNLVLSGWLYRHSAFVAATFVRSEARRRRREQTAMALHDQGDDVDWSQIAPVLDDVLAALPERDRNAIGLRFLEHQPFVEVGRSLGIGADAARMRVDRALDRLRGHLARRGVTSTTAALALGISHHGVVAAPAGLAASVAASATLTTATLVPLALLGLMSTTKIQLSLAALIAAAATTGGYLEHRKSQSLRAELAAVRADLAAHEPAGDRPDSPGAAELGALRQDRLRLMALRDEIGRLREGQARISKLEEENQALRKVHTAGSKASDDEEARDYEAEMHQGLALARMSFAKAWALAFHQYAAEHDDRLPGTFEEAATYFPKEAGAAVSVLDANRFEIVYRGSLKDIPNPAATITIREREPFSTTSAVAGGTVLTRAYAFADGHSEIHAAPDGDFESWERARMVPPP